VATAAAASPGTVTGTTTALSVLGADVDTGASSLTYTWAATTLPNGAASPIFSVNGTTAANDTTATFSEAGSYTFTVTIADPGGMTATSSVNVTINQTLTSIRVADQPPLATAYDQFANPLVDQPAFDAASDTITGPLTLSNNVTVFPAAGSPLTIAGQIAGAGALTIDNPGIVLLSGANGYAGGTIVSDGTLVLANASAIASGSSLTVGAGAGLLFTSSAVAAPAAVAAATRPTLAGSTDTSATSNDRGPIVQSGKVVIGAANGLLAGSSLTVGSASALNGRSIDWAAASPMDGPKANSAAVVLLDSPAEDSVSATSATRSLSPRAVAAVMAAGPSAWSVPWWTRRAAAAVLPAVA
jgi:autotransporter-associated beta strand protein